MQGTIRSLARDIYFAGRNHSAGSQIKVMSEPASGGYFFAEIRHGINVYILSLTEADLMSDRPKASDREPTAEVLLARVDTLFNAAYNANVEYIGLSQKKRDSDPGYRAVLSRAATRSLALNEAWQVMSGLSASAVSMRMQETYEGRDGAPIPML